MTRSSAHAAAIYWQELNRRQLATNYLRCKVETVVKVGLTVEFSYDSCKAGEPIKYARHIFGKDSLLSMNAFDMYDRLTEAMNAFIFEVWSHGKKKV